MSKENNQLALFEMKEWWEDEWEGMPEFVQDDEMPYRSITVHFRNRDDVNRFSKLVQQKITKLTPSIWFPIYKIQKRTEKYVDES